MDAREMTFGVEIETVAPDAAVVNDGLRIGPYKRGIQVPYLPTGWKAESDGSINNSRGGHKCEIVSPVLRGAEGLEQVALVVETLRAKGHRVNPSCGVHVHIGWSRDLPADALARLITIVAHLEGGLYAITGTKSRERGIFCCGVRKYGDDKRAKAEIERRRYHALNLTNLASRSFSAKQTVEFRLFSGSLNKIKVIGWIQVCLGLVERATSKKRGPAWMPKPITAGGWLKRGPGQTETERLIGYLAWSNGYAKAHGGKHFGWLDATATGVTEEMVRDAFRSLAQKYDAEA